MKIALVSDIHAEFYRNQPNWLPPLPNNSDVLVLAGDICVFLPTVNTNFCQA